MMNDSSPRSSAVIAPRLARDTATMFQPEATQMHKPELLRLNPPRTMKDELLERSSAMLSAKATLGTGLAGFLRTKERRALDHKLSGAVLAAAERVQQADLRKRSEAVELAIAVKYQTARDALRIAHRDAMSSLSQDAENLLAEGLNTLFGVRKQETEKLAAIEGDPELIAEAQRCLKGLTIASANELIHRNSDGD